MTKPTSTRMAVYLAISVVAASLIAVAFKEGGRDGQASIERITVLWPGFIGMPERDRALLGGLALTCRLETRDATVTSVEACLREGLESRSPMLPRGMSKEEAEAELNRLLAAVKARH